MGGWPWDYLGKFLEGVGGRTCSSGAEEGGGWGGPARVIGCLRSGGGNQDWIKLGVWEREM